MTYHKMRKKNIYILIQKVVRMGYALHPYKTKQFNLFEWKKINKICIDQQFLGDCTYIYYLNVNIVGKKYIVHATTCGDSL